MIRQFALITGSLIVLVGPTWAACPVTNLQVKDNAGTTAYVPYADDGSAVTNCSPQIQIKQGGNVATVTAAGAVKVDNSAVTQPVSGTVTSLLSGTVTALQGGAWSATINNVTGGTVTVLQGGSWSNTVTNANANGQATMANSSPVALSSNQSVADPCMFQAKTNVPVSVGTAISVQLVALSGSTKIYVCSAALIASTATAFSILGGTGTACATATAIIGAVTATTGMSLATNGGLTLGNGGSTVAVTGAGSELCLVQSGGGTIAGNLTYVQQ